MIRQLLSQYNLDTVEGRVAALRAAAPVVSDIRDPSLRPGYTRELSRLLGVDLADVTKAVTAAQHRSRNSESGAGSAPRQAGAAVPSAPREQPFSLVELPTDPATRLERDALMAMLQHPSLIGVDLLQRATQTTFGNQSLAVVSNGIAASVVHAADHDWLDRVLAEVPAPLANLVQQLAVAPLPERTEREVTRYVRDITVALIDRELLRLKAELLGRLQRTDAANREVYSTLQRELVRVEAERRGLREE
jgi:DNA primase